MSTTPAVARLLRRSRHVLVLAIMATVVATAGCSGQVQPPPATTEAQARASEFRQSRKDQKGELATTEILQEFEGPPEEAYRLGPGDELRVDVWGRPELSGPQIVGPDGRLTIPIVGPVVVMDLTVEEASAAVTQTARRSYAEAFATVAITKYQANRVLVLGRVSNPGVLRFDTPPTLLDAIARAGGLPVGGIGADKAALTRCAVFRGRDRVVWIDLKSLLTGRNLALNLRLKRDDVVYVPDANDQLVYVMGQVDRPGAYTLTPDMSFLDVLAQAGGPTPDAAPSRIKMVRPAMGLEKDIDINEFLAGSSAQNVALEEGDIIYVPSNTWFNIGYVLQKLSPLTGMAVFTAAMVQ